MMLRSNRTGNSADDLTAENNEISKLKETMSNMLSAVRALQDHQAKFTENLANLETDRAKFVDGIKQFETQCEQFQFLIIMIEKNEEKIDQIEVKTESLELKNETLAARIHRLELEQHFCDLTIDGIPEQPEENLVKIAEKLGSSLAVKLNPADICQVNREKKTLRGAGTITLRLRSKSLKLKLLDAARSNKVSTSDLGFAGCSSNVLLMHYLTPFMKKLKYEAKLQLKGKFDYIWISRDVRILARKNTGTKSIPIDSFADLEEILKS
jgi:Baculovirus FP protein